MGLLRRGVLPVLAAAVAVVSTSVVAAPQADASDPAFIYWSNLDTGRIGRANLDGSGVNQGLITGAQLPAGVAVEGRYVYWANRRSGTIGRATLSGTDVDQRFLAGLHAPEGLAVDGQHLYWADASRDTIGRANLDGSGVNDDFITLGTTAHGVAVDSTHIYWTTNGGKIGRANLDGTQVNQSFISTAAGLKGIAVDANHIYWAGYSAIARANLDGGAIDPSFITAARSPAALAIVNGRIYWSSLDDSSIGQAKSDGTSILNNLITGADEGGPLGIAVTGSALPRASASPGALDFASRPLLDYGTPKSVTITDSGTAPLRISSVALAGPEAGDFLIRREDCTANVLRPGGSCQISVLFGPSALGSRSATLSVHSDDPLSPLAVALSGTGVGQSVGARRSRGCARRRRGQARPRALAVGPCRARSALLQADSRRRRRHGSRRLPAGASFGGARQRAVSWSERARTCSVAPLPAGPPRARRTGYGAASTGTRWCSTAPRIAAAGRTLSGLRRGARAP